MRVNRLDIGLEAISRWRDVDEVHLPKGGPLATSFLPVQSPLDEILRRPNLDEKLVNLMQPQGLDPDLLEPSILADTRREVHAFFSAAAGAEPAGRNTFGAAASLLADELKLDMAVCTALAALLRG